MIMASKDITLYFFPTSYYSLKVLLALYEKGIPFKERIVNVFVDEQNEDWYLKMNQNGEVPVLELGGENIAESEVIIDVIDHTFTSEPPLVPDLETSTGQEVREIRMMLDDINVPLVTFGVLMNRQFCVEDIRSPIFSRFDRKMSEQRQANMSNKLLNKKKTCPPELIPAIDRKLEQGKKRHTAMSNESKVAKCLDDLEQVFDKLDARLKQSKQEIGDLQEHWLIGASFTAADVTAFILMFRLTSVGIAPRYFSSNKRQVVHEYYTRLLKRPAVQKVVAMSNSVTSYLFRQTLKGIGKRVLKYSAVIGLAAVAYAGYREYSKIHRGLAKA